MQKTTKHLALRGILLLCAVSATLARAEQSEVGPDNGNGAPSSPDQGGSAYPPVQQYPPKLPEQEQKQMPEPKPETEPKPEPEQPEQEQKQMPETEPKPEPEQPEQERKQMPETEPKPEPEQPAYPPAQQIPPKQPEPQPEQPTYSAETLTKPEVVEAPITTPEVPEPETATPVETPVESENGESGPEDGGNTEEATPVETPVENGNGGNGPEDGGNMEETPAGAESDTPTTLPAFVTQLLGLLDKIGDEGQEGLAEDQSIPTETNTEGGEGEPKEDSSAVQTDDGNGGDSADGGIAARNLATDKEPEREPGRPTPTPSARYTTEDIYTRVRIPLYRLTAFQQAIRTITTTAHPEEETEPAADEEEVNPEEEEAGEEGQNRGERRPGRDSNSRVRATFTVTETRKTTTSEETTLTETTTSPTTTHKQPSTTETTHTTSPTTTTAIGHAARGATPQIGGLVTLLAVFLALLSGVCDRVLI
ncbi:hypothetical protein IWQ61_002700 [Dispira simplex]|nr:hypothetical protein IWQ61_002700 [Dispira simplex]